MRFKQTWPQVLLALALWTAAFGGTAARAQNAPGAPLEAWQLQSTAGGRVNERSFDGRWLVVYLGATRCGSRCEPPLRLMQTVLDGLGWWERRGVVGLFLSIDPVRDTPEGLARYLAPLAPRGEGLVGRSFDMNTAARALGVATADVCRSDANEARTQEEQHARKLYVVTPDRRLALTLDEADAPDWALRELRRLMSLNTR